MKRKMLYISSPIDQLGRAGLAIRSKRESLRNRANADGWDVVDAASAVQTSPGNSAAFDSRIGKIHHRAMTLCDALVAVWPHGVASAGVPMEIERMRGEMPVLVWTQTPTESAMLVNPLIELVSWDESSLGVMERVIEADKLWVEALHNRTEPMYVKLIGEHAEMPQQQHVGDAGFDLYTSEHRMVLPGAYRNIPTGVYVELPHYAWGMLMGRSSTLQKRGLLVNQAVIDNGWRGELFAGVKNLSSETVEVAPGERVAQFVPMGISADRLRLVQVESLSDHERGTNGFGSTGT